MGIATEAGLPAEPALQLENSGRRRTELRIWLAMGVITALVTAIYAGAFGTLVRDWWNDTAGASYGMLIPPLALYIAWIGRERTFSIPVRPDARGLGVIFVSCLMFLVGKLGAEYFITRLSLVLLLGGLALTFWGWARSRTLGFPMLLLLTMIPLPLLVYSRITLPLQLLSSEAAAWIVQFLGGSIYREGNVLYLPHTTLGVAEACSGLHSLESLIVAALLLGFTMCTRMISRVLLVLLAAPMAIAVNVARVTGTVFLADINTDYAEGFYHAFAGWFVFLIGFGCTYVVAVILHRWLDGASKQGVAQ
jgi:exosortase